MRRAVLVAAVMTMLMTMAGAASATTGRIDWNGSRGADSINTCGQDQDGYLHWVLTPGGKSKLSTAGTTLTIDGDSYAAYRNGEGGGAIHFLTDYYDPEDISEAYASFSGTAGRNALLTISSGCALDEDPGDPGDPGTDPDPDDPDPVECDQATASGGAGITTTLHELGQSSGTFQFDYIAYFFPDRFEVFYEGQKLLDEVIGTGANDPTWALLYEPGGIFHGTDSVDPVNDKTAHLTYSGSSTQVTIRVSGPGGTVWDYTVHCPE